MHIYDIYVDVDIINVYHACRIAPQSSEFLDLLVEGTDSIAYLIQGVCRVAKPGSVCSSRFSSRGDFTFYQRQVPFITAMKTSAVLSL